MSTRKFLTTICAASALALMAGAASAATLSFVGGTAGNIPGGATNDGLGPLGLTNPLAGYYGAQVNLDSPARVTMTLLGSEAGYTNTFKYNPTGETLVAGGNTAPGIWDPSGLLGNIVATVTTSGLLDFSFLSSGSSSVDNVTGNPSAPADGITSFFASFAHDTSATSGTSLYLFLDDGGAGPDDNHDDLVMRIDVAPIPVPAGGLLLLGALGGLGVISRRKKKAA